MASDHYTDRQPSQREEWRATNQYTSHAPSHQEEHRERASEQSANRPPPHHERWRPREQYNQPPAQRMKRESFLSRAKRRAGFWLAAIPGILVIFVLVAVVYGTADSMGLIDADMWMVNFGMICGLVGSWWLYGQFLKKKFGYPSIFR